MVERLLARYTKSGSVITDSVKQSLLQSLVSVWMGLKLRFKNTKEEEAWFLGWLPKYLQIRNLLVVEFGKLWTWNFVW